MEEVSLKTSPKNVIQDMINSKTVCNKVCFNNRNQSMQTVFIQTKNESLGESAGILPQKVLKIRII